MTAPGASIHDLLVHADFLRRLVRDLVADDAGRRDLTQQVWLQALRSPPRDARGLRGWLATTARNLVANSRRSDARRAARELDAAPREHAPAADEILAREAVRESVLRAVLALDEPFREAVLLRYYEGLAPREIAARLGVPDATVRTRVARGLERLRARLDAQHRDRSAWAIAALPLARAESAPFGIAGAFAVKKLVAVVVLLVLAVVAWRYAAGEDVESSDARPGAEVASLTLADAREPALAVALAEGDRRAADVAAAPTAPVSLRARRTFPAERGRASVHGSAVDAYDAPLAGVVVRARPHLGGTPPGIALDDDRTRTPEATTDASGLFRIADVDEGPVRVEATFPDGSSAQRVIVLGAGEDAGPISFAAADARAAEVPLQVLVVDAGGAPVPDARVEVFGWSRSDRDPELVDAQATKPAASGTSGADGIAVIGRPSLAHGVVLARATDGRAGWSALRTGGMMGSAPSALRVEVSAAGSIDGVITGASDESLRGARLALHALSTLEPYHTASGRRIDVALDGARFAVRDLAAGTYAVALDAPGGVRLAHPRQRWGEQELENSIANLGVVVEAGRATRVELAAAPAARLRGRVTASGAPVANARVRAVLAPRTPNYPAGFALHGVNVWRFDDAYEQAPDAPVSHRVARTDADGRYELASLAPGRWRVEVAADGLTFDRRHDVELTEGIAAELEHALVEAGVLQVGVLEATYLGVFAADAEKPAMIAVVRDGCATFAGLAPGRYRVASLHSDESVPHVFLGEATVEAGRTTWADLRASGERARVRGTVRVDGAPLAGATVGIHPATAITDAAGRFEIRRERRPGFGAIHGASVKVSHAGIEFVFVPGADAASADRELELDLTGGALAIEVVDGDGRAVSARIAADWTPASVSPTGSGGAMARVGAHDGRFTLAPLGPGSFAGTATYTDEWSVRFACTLPRAEPLRVTRPASGSLTVRVLRGGRGVDGRRVALASGPGVDGVPTFERNATTGADGTITVEAPAGDVTASVRGGFLGPSTKGAARVEPGRAAEIVLELDN